MQLSNHCSSRLSLRCLPSLTSIADLRSRRRARRARRLGVCLSIVVLAGVLGASRLAPDEQRVRVVVQATGGDSLRPALVDEIELASDQRQLRIHFRAWAPYDPNNSCSRNYDATVTVENGTLVIGVFQTATPNLEIDQLCETVGRLRTTDVVLDPPFVGSQVGVVVDPNGRSSRLLGTLVGGSSPTRGQQHRNQPTRLTSVLTLLRLYPRSSE